ncbi:MAG: cytochrome c biogenesis protein CcsA [Sulfurovum sp.]|nr:cytochrome c biogenesis protein CcsA [Sulfurovum sp.]
MLKKIFSMKMAVLMLFSFGIIIGVATFIENDYGTQTACALVYKAKWFEIFLAYFISILIYQITTYKTYKTKFPIFLFHFSFVVIALGALITRYVGYEGIMHIREGQMTNKMVSDIKVMELFVKTKEHNASLEKPLFFSTMTHNDLSESLKVGNKVLKVSLETYLPTADEEVVSDLNGTTLLEMKISAGGRGKIYYFKRGDIKDFDTFYVSYGAVDTPTDKPTFKITGKPDHLQVNFPLAIKTLNMDTRTPAKIQPGDNPLTRRILYRFGNSAIVLKDIHKKSTIKIVSHALKTKSGKPEYIKLNVTVGNKSKEVVFRPMKGQVGDLKQFTLNGMDIQMRIGAKVITLPFAIKLVDFELDRYPGSMTPASYSSRVILVDQEKGIRMPYHIYMNHVLDHRNYRFFQSSYDPDEEGTVLSVNHDPGTLPIYIAYFLLGLGMIWSLFIPNGRFQKLLKGVRKLQYGMTATLVVIAFLMAPQHTKAAPLAISTDVLKQMHAYSIEHTKNFGTLPVQDHRGRMKPMDTVAHDVIAKITGRTKLYDLDPDQMFLGMTIQPEIYQNVPMIKIGHKKIALALGLPEDTQYAKFTDFFKREGDRSYKLFDAVTKASRKNPSERSKYDRELIKIDERVNVSYMTYQGTLMRIYPVPHDKNNKWVAPLDALKTFSKVEKKEVQLTISAYFAFVTYGLQTGDWSKANLGIAAIKKYQRRYGAEVLPSPDHIKAEIWYNRLGLFSKLFPVYLMLGLILLIFAFTHVLRPNFSMKWVMRIAWITLIVAFALHVTGMGIRWYIAGHAPWSNAYESIVFIAAATVLAGIILTRRSPFALAGTALLAGITMSVAHLSFINPQITNLVPVLKSYWLMMHVAIITSGDGFLGLGSILSLMVLILFIARGKEGHENIDRSIKELTNLSEMALIIGLMLLTVGNFLGGVWANESWGRYWGWDSKETWAAVTILIYAAVLHMRFIAKLNNTFIYNVAATWAYSAILMTYFGVNYYLSGLHSYAAGDPVPIPMWVYYGVAGLFVLTLLATKNRNLAKTS